MVSVDGPGTRGCKEKGRLRYRQAGSCPGGCRTQAGGRWSWTLDSTRRSGDADVSEHGFRLRSASVQHLRVAEWWSLVPSQHHARIQRPCTAARLHWPGKALLQADGWDRQARPALLARQPARRKIPSSPRRRPRPVPDACKCSPCALSLTAPPRPPHD
jgi:hypothetical protein